MSEISLLSPGTEIARWAVLPRWAVFGKFPLCTFGKNLVAMYKNGVGPPPSVIPLLSYQTPDSETQEVGGVQPQKTQKNPNPKWNFKLFLGFLGFLVFF